MSSDSLRGKPITVRDGLEKAGVDVDALLDREMPVAAHGAIIVLSTMETELGTFQLVIRGAP